MTILPGSADTPAADGPAGSPLSPPTSPPVGGGGVDNEARANSPAPAAAPADWFQGFLRPTTSSTNLSA